MMSKTQKTVLAAMLLAAGIIVQAIEALYIPPLIIPGAKIGLANVITLAVLILFGGREVIGHVVLRVTAVALLTGTFLSTTYLYSLAGGTAAALTMTAIYRVFYGPLSFVGISLIGAVAHNIAQAALAVFIIGHVGVLALTPWLLAAAVITGCANGLLANMLQPRLADIQASRFGMAAPPA